MSSASAEYPPLSLVILGSHIFQNSFDACTAAASDTSAAIVAAFLESLARGTMGLTSKVLLLRTVLATRCSVDVYFSACAIVEISDTLVELPAMSELTYLPLTSHQV